MNSERSLRRQLYLYAEMKSVKHIKTTIPSLDKFEQTIVQCLTFSANVIRSLFSVCVLYQATALLGSEDLLYKIIPPVTRVKVVQRIDNGINTNRNAYLFTFSAIWGCKTFRAIVYTTARTALCLQQPTDTVEKKTFINSNFSNQ